MIKYLQCSSQSVQRSLIGAFGLLLVPAGAVLAQQMSGLIGAL